LSVLFIVIVLAILISRLQVHSPQANLKVLTYSAFLNSWGPGPLLAQNFFKESGARVEFIDAGDAGLINEKLKIFKADIVLGLDQFGILHAGSEWLDLHHQPSLYSSRFFQAIDWAPMTFIYRKSETLAPPKNLDDLLSSRFIGKISIPDPRTSTPGLQFLFWIVKTKGFEYLQKLNASIGFVGSSWSASYGAFKKKQSALTFSYFTSPVYHWSEEKNFDYQPVFFEEPLPLQVEYVAIPLNSEHAELAKRFVEFLLKPDAQKILMQKNFMLPMRSEVAEQTEFSRLPKVKTLDAFELSEMYKDRENILNKWQSMRNQK
jgi:thiamine transport system substrate-binding protein